MNTGNNRFTQPQRPHADPTLLNQNRQVKRPAPPATQRKREPSGNFDNPIMNPQFTNFVGSISNLFGTLFAVAMLIGLLIFGSMIDVVFGGFALGLVFENPIPFGNWMINPDFLATAVSVITSGVQVYLLLTWTSHGRKLSASNKIVMLALIILDTALDITAPAYLMTGETALTLTFADKSAGFFIVLAVSGGACAIAENVIVFLAGLKDRV